MLSGYADGMGFFIAVSMNRKGYWPRVAANSDAGSA
jgi:hypothetical protein